MAYSANGYAVLLRYWPGFTEKFSVDSFMLLPDADVIEVFVAAVDAKLRRTRRVTWRSSKRMQPREGSR